ncbi:acyl carrier protein [Chitinasiproducens palmae]|uniref:acyl carrier protein n=1 Tax=Chitinasiproducens palmae TaxID=1770053 RepID=UPI000B81622A|nr:acyl carrier protein [Chitinasiproducens palmae]
MRATVRRVVSDAALLEVPLDALDDNADLYSAGLASMTSVRVMVALEDEFGIEIPDRLLTRKLFRNIASLTDAVVVCLAEARQ